MFIPTFPARSKWEGLGRNSHAGPELIGDFMHAIEFLWGVQLILIIVDNDVNGYDLSKSVEYKQTDYHKLSKMDN